ncbi:MAG: ubiquinone biosynthesis protein [Myxococcota bacterium]|jgi:ubiquinone biosynthesis protein
MNSSPEDRSAETRARATGILQKMSRRPLLAELGEDDRRPQIRRYPVPDASPLLVVIRAFRWCIALAVFAGVVVWDRLRGERSPRLFGARLRRVFEQVGGTAVKLGQQLAVRVDFLPFEVSQELSLLMDSVPPFETDKAIQRITALTGESLDETFKHFDRTPIGAASIACVWRGTLHSGEVVAVKVRRPGVEKLFAADLTILSLMTRLLEATTIVRSGFFKYLRTDLVDMFMGELDLCREANHQMIWRRYVKNDRIKWLSAPKVFAHLSDIDILTTEFVDGYPCADVLAATETGDIAALKTLASVGIDPAIIGQRIMQVGMWGRMECPFFHADPHPGNIIIRPDNHIVLIDFGACGVVSREMASHQIEMSRRLINDDISGGTAVTLALLAPLPNIDATEIQRVLEQVMWNFQITVRSDDAEWWERTSAALWVWTLEAIRRFNLPINLDVLLFIRSTLLYDTLACRLDPSINVEKSFKTWRKKARKRVMRRSRRQWRPVSDRVTQELGEIGESVRKGVYVAGHLSRNLPREFSAASSKSAHFASSMLKIGTASSLLFFGTLLAATAWSWRSSGELNREELLQIVASHPGMVAIVVLITASNLRRVLARLNEFDPEET